MDSRQGVLPVVAYSHTVTLLKLEEWCALLCQFPDRKLLRSAQCNLPFAGAQPEVISRYLQGEIDTQRIAVPVGKLPQMHTSPLLGVIPKPKQPEKWCITQVCLLHGEQVAMKLFRQNCVVLTMLKCMM